MTQEQVNLNLSTLRQIDPTSTPEASAIVEELLAELGDGEHSPNWEGNFTLDVGKGATGINALVCQGISAWIIPSHLWVKLKYLATKPIGRLAYLLNKTQVEEQKNESI